MPWMLWLNLLATLLRTAAKKVGPLQTDSQSPAREHAKKL